MFTSISIPSLLLYPPNLCLVLLVVAIFLAIVQKKKFALSLSGVGLLWVLVWSLPASALYFGGKLEKTYPYYAPTAAAVSDVVVVLGGNTQANRANWFESYNRLTAVDRVDRAAELFMANKAKYIIVSGGSLEGPISEAHGMARLLRLKGVPDSAILLENESRNTYENALFSQKIIQQHGWTDVAVVTSALHMPRAMAVFRKLDMTVTASGMRPQIVVPQHASINLWLPHVRSLEASRSIIKEYLGLLGYWLRHWL